MSRTLTPVRPALNQESRVHGKLNYLATRSGLTAFEREFVAGLRTADRIPTRKLRILAVIWQRHRRPTATLPPTTTTPRKPQETSCQTN